MEMPFLSKETFLNAVDMVVKNNESWVPPYGSGASFYLRPYLFATGPVLGVKPADTYEFRMGGLGGPEQHLHRLFGQQGVGQDHILAGQHIRKDADHAVRRMIGGHEFARPGLLAQLLSQRFHAPGQSRIGQFLQDAVVFKIERGAVAGAPGLHEFPE